VATPPILVEKGLSTPSFDGPTPFRERPAPSSLSTAEFKEFIGYAAFAERAKN
jgi:hypothetical protein